MRATLRVVAACCALVASGRAPAVVPIGATQAASTVAASELLDAYEKGDYARVEAGLTDIADPSAFVVDLQRAAAVWTRAAPSEAAPRRRLVAAAVALEAAARHLEAPEMRRDLIEWGAERLAQDPPRAGERVWYIAAMALSQRAYDTVIFRAGGKETAAWDLAAARFPGEDRLHLAPALALELASWRAVQQAQAIGGHRGGAGILQDLVRAFEALLERKSIRAEVHLRLGHTWLRLGKPTTALEHFAQVEPLTNDPFLRYLSWYFTGRARQANGERAAAETAFRGALEIVPRAQSASLSLAALAFGRDARDDAYAAVAAAVSGTAPVDDPWRLYQAADSRFLPAFLELLRKETR